MCGIVGLVSKNDVVEKVLDGLKRLEYRGYDSAGIATLSNGKIERRRSEGKLKALQENCDIHPIHGNIAIGHTRWATHGVASVNNAHPHMNNRIALVHNGIIENHNDLKKELCKKYTFESQTDTEVVVYVIEEELKKGHDPLTAVQNAVKQLRGAYALAIVFKDTPDQIIAVRKGSPLVVGKSDEHGTMLGSDAITLAPWATTLCYLEDGDLAVLDLDTITLYDEHDQKVQRPFKANAISMEVIGKGEYRHYMLKEIFEQPTVIGNALQHILESDANHIHFSDLHLDFSKIDRISIIACGTSYYAGMVAKYWFENIAHVGVEVDIASEFRYRSPVFSKNHLCVFISQSGETIDTLAAMELAKNYSQTLGIVNVPQSSIARMSDHVVYTHAGPEIGVASTKAFTCQLVSLLSLVLMAAKQKSLLNHDAETHFIQDLRSLPLMAHTVLHEESMKGLAHTLHSKHLVIMMGRGLMYPIALEGALKLKEITYIPSHAYAAGEMKHGPIAMIDATVPVIVLAPYDKWFEKTCGNIQEVLARKGNVIVFTDQKGAPHIQNMMPDMFSVHKNLFILPYMNENLTPFLYVLPLQLLTYYTGLEIGTDVDQPRNLAKSVTVE